MNKSLLKVVLKEKCLQNCYQALEDFAGNIVNLKETAPKLKVGN